MRADHLTYRRATSTSLLGLTLQVVLAVVFLLYGLFARDGAGISAALYIGLGTMVWLALALVFHQHTLERLEAIEQDALSASGASEASVFERAGDELRPAAARLAWLHRVLLPVVSLLYAASLIGSGVMRFLASRKSADIESFVPPSLPGWAIAVGLGAAALGFIFARFVAGMAKQTAWANLRAGAACAVGAALVGLATAIAHFVSYLGNDAVLRHLGLAIPLFAAFLGLESLANFVLNIYRPRRKGETPRAAFDSRILGFLAAPDRLAESFGQAISYQFGFDVTTSWFYRLLSRTIVLLALFGAGMLWALSSLAVIKPNERGLILHFGALKREVGSGLHFKWPWPIERLETFPALAVNEIDVATPSPTVEGPILWTTAHLKEGAETFVLVQPTAGGAGVATSSDLSLVAVEAPLHYIVRNLEKYERLAPKAMRQPLLKAVASRELIEELGSRSMDEALGARRDEINASLKARISRAYDRLDAGVEVLFVGIAGAHPPQDEDVAPAYERVVAAEQTREATIERARAEAIKTRTRVAGDAALSESILAEINELERLKTAGAEPGAITARERAIDDLLATAGGQARDAIALARADRWSKHMRERSRATRHEGRTAAYRAAPSVYRAQLYFGALSDLAATARVYISAFDHPKLRFNLEDVQDVGSVPAAVKPRED